MALKEGRSTRRLGLLKNEELDFQLHRTFSAMRHGGADVGDVSNVVATVRSNGLDRFSPAFMQLGRSKETAAREMLSSNRHRSARRAYLQAANYYNSAVLGCGPRHVMHKEAWKRSRTCFEAVGELGDHLFVRADIPYERHTLPCYFLGATNAADTSGGRREAPTGKRPTLIVVTGGEGTAVETYFWIGAEAQNRGYNVLLYEGPGNISAMYTSGLTFRHDAEIPIGAAIDWLLTRSDVDPDAIAIIGFSFAGYLVARAAAFDERIKALIPNSPLRNVPAMFRAVFPKFIFSAPPKLVQFLLDRLLRGPVRDSLELAMWEGGTNSFTDFIDGMEAFILEPYEHQIACPTLVLASEGEGTEFIDQAHAFFESISSKDKRMHVFSHADGAGAHCQINGTALMNDVVLDWLDTVFGDA